MTPPTDEARAGEPRRFRVDGQDFENAEAVNRYLVSGHTKAELIDLLMVFIHESVEVETAAAPTLDVPRLRQAMSTVMGNYLFHFPNAATALAAEYARLSEETP